MTAFFYLLKEERIRYYKKICMLSGVPVKRDDQVKVFFLAIAGSYLFLKNVMVVF